MSDDSHRFAHCFFSRHWKWLLIAVEWVKEKGRERDEERCYRTRKCVLLFTSDSLLVKMSPVKYSQTFLRLSRWDWILFLFLTRSFFLNPILERAFHAQRMYLLTKSNLNGKNRRTNLFVDRIFRDIHNVAFSIFHWTTSSLILSLSLTLSLSAFLSLAMKHSHISFHEIACTQLYKTLKSTFHTCD